MCPDREAPKPRRTSGSAEAIENDQEILRVLYIVVLRVLYIVVLRARPDGSCSSLVEVLWENFREQLVLWGFFWSRIEKCFEISFPAESKKRARKIVRLFVGRTSGASLRRSSPTRILIMVKILVGEDRVSFRQVF